MKRPKPGFKEYIKTRYKHPLKPRCYITFTGQSGERLCDAGSPHTVIIDLTAGLLISVTILFLNCTVWYIMLCAAIVLLLYHLRYYWTNFKPADEDGNIIESGGADAGQTDAAEGGAEHTRYTRKYKALIAVEVILMLAAAPGAYFLSADSDYARAPKDNIVEVGDEHVYPHYQNIESLPQAYVWAEDWALRNAPNAVITHYGMQISDEGVYYNFVFRNQAPGFLIKRTHEFEIMKAYIKQTNYGLLYFCYYLYDSPYSSFNAVSPPKVEINAEKIIDILKEKAGIDREGTGFYIATGFLTDLPELSEPGGDIWAVHIRSGDRFLYYTVDISKETARLERADKADETP